MIKPWIKQWFGIWGDGVLRGRVAGEYAALKSSKLLLADLAARNYLFAPGPDAENLFAAGVAEGRRRAVLELLDLVRVDPADLAEVTVRPARRETDKGDDDGGSANASNWRRWASERRTG